VLASLAAAAALLTAWSREAGPVLPESSSGPVAMTSTATRTPPFAAGDDAANIALRRRDDRVLIRWVARSSGRLRSLFIRVKVAPAGYGGGTTGILRATTPPVRPDGTPRLSVVLGRTTVSPGRSQWGGTVELPLRLGVRAGQEFATVIRNAAANPYRDYFSPNFLHADDGLLGANARNERSSRARDAYYGLDPRELVGFSSDGGRTWRLPGGPYGANGGRAFIPTYVQLYDGGLADGQSYYYSEPVSGTVTMVYPNVRRDWRITGLGAFARGGSGRLVLGVNGDRRAAVRVSGSGFDSKAITPVVAPKGSTVTVTTRAGSGGLSLSQQFADSVWARLMGLGTSFRWYLDGAPQTAVPIYPIPAPPAG